MKGIRIASIKAGFSHDMLRTLILEPITFSELEFGFFKYNNKFPFPINESCCILSRIIGCSKNTIS